MPCLPPRSPSLLAAAIALSTTLGHAPVARAVTRDPQAEMRSMIGKSITVYTTAAQTDLRLTQGAPLAFAPMAQPLETEPCVFVEPGVSFQTIVGIGGALTDSAAETFAKLPPATQQQFLTAYYDPVKGIGYTMGRTNIKGRRADLNAGGRRVQQHSQKQRGT